MEINSDYEKKKVLFAFEYLDTNYFCLLILSIPGCCFVLCNSEKWNNKTTLN